VRGDAVPEVEAFPDPPSGARVALVTLALLATLALTGVALAGFGGSGNGGGDDATVAAKGSTGARGDTDSAGAGAEVATTTSTTAAPVPEPPASNASLKAPPTLPDSGIGVLDGEELVLIDATGKVFVRGKVGPTVYPHGPGRPWSVMVEHGNVVLTEASGRVSPARGTFAKDCTDAQTGGPVTVARCGPADPGTAGASRIDIDTGDGRGTRPLIASPPVAAGTDIVGHWAAAMPSPDGKWVLAQWSSECEVPVAFFVEPATGAARTVTGEQGVNWTKASNSVAAGWTDDASAVVALPREPGCGSGTAAGVYLVRPPNTKQRIFRSKTNTPSVFLWARKVAPKWDHPLSTAGSDGTIAVDAFNAYVAEQRPGWAATPEALAAAFTQADRQPGAEQPAPTIAASGRRADGTVEVTVTFDRLADDSIRTQRYVVVVTPASTTAPASLVEARASWRCQPNRGHQTFSTDLCV
jgi:hypothetical protein